MFKMWDKNKKDWYEQLPYDLCAYRISIKKTIGEALFYLVYANEAIVSLEFKLLSLQISLQGYILLYLELLYEKQL